MKCIKFTDESNYIKDFINLPKQLYSKKDLMEDPKEMKKLLLGTHPLSSYFKLDKFLIYDNDKVVGRFIITTYENDSNAYIGFFECINDQEIASFLFKEAREFCKKNKYESIVGPVDASFWIKYRLKINTYDKEPYTGEPYNKDYYFDLFKENGYQVIEHYTSNLYQNLSDDYSNEKYVDRFKKMKDLGYEIKSPDINDFDKTLEEIYYLITNLYSDFPIYKDVSLEDFKQVFNSYKSIINTSMVKMAYFNNKAVGFFISIPDYGNIVYNLNAINILKILKLRKKPKRYVMLYMGVDQEHKGLGKALVFSIMEELRKTGIPSIGALARDGKVTQNYAEDMLEKRYEYVLLKEDIK